MSFMFFSPFLLEMSLWTGGESNPNVLGDNKTHWPLCHFYSFSCYLLEKLEFVDFQSMSIAFPTNDFTLWKPLASQPIYTFIAWNTPSDVDKSKLFFCEIKSMLVYKNNARKINSRMKNRCLISLIFITINPITTNITITIQCMPIMLFSSFIRGSFGIKRFSLIYIVKRELTMR